MKTIIDMSRGLKVVTLLRGARGPQQTKQSLISDQEELKVFFDGAPPEIELPKGFVGAIALGPRKTGGIHVDIKNAYQITFGIATGIVHINYAAVSSGGIHTDEITHPFIIFSLPDLEYATSVVFNNVDPAPVGLNSFDAATKDSNKFIVIADTVTGQYMQIIPEHALYPMVFSQIFGPAAYEDCQDFINQHAKGPVPTQPSGTRASLGA